MKESLCISILGDICPSWGYEDSFKKGNPSIVFGDVLPLLQASDYVVGNIECPASNRGIKCKKTGPNIRCYPTDLYVLKDAGIDALAMANNHILDYGEEALLDTLDNAERAGLKSFGAGKTAKSAAKPLFFEKNGWKIGFIALAEEEFNCVTDNRAGANKFDPYLSFSQIFNTEKDCDYLVVQYHGGIEHYKYPSPLLQTKCRAMVEAGADLVLCQHSHCIGTYEEYKGSTILYGQGNAVFGMQEGDKEWNQGILAQVVFGLGEKPLVTFRVFEAAEKGIALLSAICEVERLNQLREDSLLIGDSDFVYAQWRKFCQEKKAMYLPLLFAKGRVFNKLNRMTGNALIRIFTSKNKQRVAMNLLRCDAHREVCQTILEDAVK